MRTTHLLAIATAVALAACGAAADDPTDLTGAEPTSSTEQPSEAPADDVADEPDEPDDEPSEEPTNEPEDTGTDEPAPDEGDADATPGTDCSAAGVGDEVRGDDLPADTRAMADFLLDAAVRCDEPLLRTAATESDTSFLFGNATVGEVFVLPEPEDADPTAWSALARLLHGTTPTLGADGEVWTWPAAAAADADDADWQELVDSGLYKEAEVTELRAAPDGYLGWRLGIDADGTWLFFTVGD